MRWADGAVFEPAPYHPMTYVGRELHRIQRRPLGWWRRTGEVWTVADECDYLITNSPAFDFKAYGWAYQCMRAIDRHVQRLDRSTRKLKEMSDGQTR